MEVQESNGTDCFALSAEELVMFAGCDSFEERFSDTACDADDCDDELGAYSNDVAYRVLNVLSDNTCSLGSQSLLCTSEDAYRVDVVVKLDTACSKNMSGVPGRLDPSTMYVRDVMIKGFNNSVSSAATAGLNEDRKEEYFVASMPRNLALLCAHEYTKEGATVLFPDNGVVIKLNKAEQEQLREFIRPFPLVKKLVVRNRTYEVDPDPNTSPPDYSDTTAFSSEECNSSTASRYFNSKVNVSNTQERVLATLLTGLSFQDIYSMSKNESVVGLPRDLTVAALNHFEHRNGRNPDALQLALPNLAGNTKGYMAPRPSLTHCGQRVEADYFECDFNDPSTVITTAEGAATARRKLGKLPSHGGAIAAFVSIDAYSGYVHGRLVNNLRDSVDHVKFVREKYRSGGVRYRIICC